jgi:hypothetical protein
MMMRENPFDYVEEKPKKKDEKKDIKGGKTKTGVAK